MYCRSAPTFLFFLSLSLLSCAESESILTVEGRLTRLQRFEIPLEDYDSEPYLRQRATFTSEGLALINDNDYYDDEAILYNVLTGKEIRTLMVARSIGAITSSNDGKYVGIAYYYGSNRYAASVLDMETGKELHSALLTDAGHISALAFNTDKTKLALATSNGVALWDISGTKVKQKTIGQKNQFYPITSLEFSSTEDTILSSPPMYWSVSEMNVVERFVDTRGFFEAAHFLQGQTQVIAAGSHGLTLFSLGGKEPIGRITDFNLDQDPSGPSTTRIDIISMDVSRDGRRIATGDNEGNVQVWDATNGELIALDSTSARYIMAVTFSPFDSSILASTGTNGEVIVWRIEE